MEVICLEDRAFYTLVETVVKRIEQKSKPKTTEKWVSSEDAMRLLNITSKSTLQKFRDEGRIRYSQPERKIILYDTDSIEAFLNKNAKDTF